MEGTELELQISVRMPWPAASPDPIPSLPKGHGQGITPGYLSLKAKAQCSCQVEKHFKSVPALISKTMVAMESEYLLIECLPSLSLSRLRGHKLWSRGQFCCSLES